MEFEILLRRLQLYPALQAAKMLSLFLSSHSQLSLAQKQQAMDIIAAKEQLLKGVKPEKMMEAVITIMDLATLPMPVAKAFFEETKKYPMLFWIESLAYLNEKMISIIIERFHEQLPPSLYYTFVVQLPDEEQLRFLNRYPDKLDPKDEFFECFCYAACDEARENLFELYPEVKNYTVLDELQDAAQEKLESLFYAWKDQIGTLDPELVVRFVLTKTNSVDFMTSFLRNFKGVLEKVSFSLFRLFYIRYQYLKSKTNLTKLQHHVILDEEYFCMFNQRFRKIGYSKTLCFFNHQTTYGPNPFVKDITLSMIDIAYDEGDLSKFINDVTLIDTTSAFVDLCTKKLYDAKDLDYLVASAGQRTKLILDDFIEAMIALGRLMDAKVITNQSPIYLTLKDKFADLMYERCHRDGTYTEDIPLDGLFYRLVKGRLPYTCIVLTKTYRGLIYLCKCSGKTNYADQITKRLSDEQVANLNISLVEKWIKKPLSEATKDIDMQISRRIGLQLLSLFGEQRGEYVYHSGMEITRFEYIFDSMDYRKIYANEKENPNMYSALLDFLFGKGGMKEKNSTINRLIRGEIPKFETYLSTLYSDFPEVFEKCYGVLSVKRILRYYAGVDFPIELKPDELRFLPALQELGSNDEDLLRDAIEQCKCAERRTYSTIPKIKGELGRFRYEMLDLDDPSAVCVGELSHCCFILGGESDSALRHSMRSVNGRTFVVYYDNKFLCQSWVWRNGDVICFDSVEAGSIRHGMLADNLHVKDIYLAAAEELLAISEKEEPKEECVKAVTVGRSDFVFDNLERIPSPVPRPLEADVYVYDSREQYLLAGQKKKNFSYGKVSARYLKPRKKVQTVQDISSLSADAVDSIQMCMGAISYRARGVETPILLTDYKKIILGEDWFILIYNDGTVLCDLCSREEVAIQEYEAYLAQYGLEQNVDLSTPFYYQLERKESL